MDVLDYFKKGIYIYTYMRIYIYIGVRLYQKGKRDRFLFDAVKTRAGQRNPANFAGVSFLSHTFLSVTHTHIHSDTHTHTHIPQTFGGHFFSLTTTYPLSLTHTVRLHTHHTNFGGYLSPNTHTVSPTHAHDTHTHTCRKFWGLISLVLSLFLSLTHTNTHTHTHTHAHLRM